MGVTHSSDLWELSREAGVRRQRGGGLTRQTRHGLSLACPSLRALSWTGEEAGPRADLLCCVGTRALGNEDGEDTVFPERQGNLEILGYLWWPMAW